MVPGVKRQRARANWELSCATSPHLSPGLFLSPEPERNRLLFLSLCHRAEAMRPPETHDKLGRNGLVRHLG